MKRPTRAVFWDIDGTLLVTGRAGMIAWERALTEATGAAVFPPVRPDGLTDHQIADWLLRDGTEAAPRVDEASADAVSRLVARYEALLVDALPLRQGRVLANVPAVLEWMIAQRGEVLCWLVTGNTRAGGTAKLRHYALDRYFEDAASGAAPRPLSGSFSERVEPRARIVDRALAMARARMPDLAPEEALVVGDTPHDIEGARAIGVPTLAVATNTHTFEELQGHHPWRTLRELPAPADFAGILTATSS